MRLNKIKNIYLDIRKNLHNLFIQIFNLIKNILISKIFTALINVILTFFLVLLAKNTLDLNRQIQQKDIDILAAHRYNIAYDVRNFISEYIDNAVEFIILESNKVLILNSQHSNKNILENYIDTTPLENSAESWYLINPWFCDFKGDSVAAYFQKISNLRINVKGFLKKDELIQYRKLLNSIEKCNSELRYIINRLHGSHEKTVKLLVKKKRKEGKFDVKKYDLRNNPVHLYFINKARNYVKDVKENTDKFLNFFNDIEIDSLKFICQIKPPVSFSKLDDIMPKPSPRVNATIIFDSTYYEFDYFKYFIEHIDSTDWPDDSGATEFTKIN